MKQKILNNWILKILSVVVALVIWLAVTNVSDPVQTKTITGIPIHLTDTDALTEQNKLYSSVSSSYATVTISGRRSIVSGLSADDFQATAPLSEISIVNAVPVYVTLTGSTYRSEVTITKKTESIQLKLEDIISKDYNITVRYTGETADSYMVKETTLGKEYVTVTAPESVHDLINQVAVTIDVDGAKDNLSGQYKLELYTSNDRAITIDSNTSFSTKKVKATTTILKQKEVEVEFSVTGEPAEGYSYTDLNVDKSKITLAGKATLIDSINKIVIPASVLNIAGRKANLETTVNLLDYIPAGTELVDEEDASANVVVSIEQESVRSVKLVPDVDVKMSNIPDGLAAKIISTDELTLQLRGMEDVLEQITDVASLNPTVDLTGLTAGEVTVPITFTLPDGVELLEEAAIEVRLVDEQTDTTQETETETVTEQETE
jgi:YbbR domain-containing protein